MYGMNQNFNAGDPSGLVPGQILPHVHLVSSYRFPTLPALQPTQALEYLIKGPQIVKDTSPVAWTYFPSPPPDGTVLLTWQPPRLGPNFASDGLVWADPEQSFEMNQRGYTLQIMVHKSGFHYPHEPFSTHARYRYRIAHGPGHIDPNLWIVHYFTAEPPNRIPASQIPIPREVHASLATRAQLENAGQLVRKEFMLADRQNWPKVEFARGASREQPPYYNPMAPGRPYNQPPPSKRARTTGQPRPPVPSAIAADLELQEEENATQDFFDFLTPRDISLSRYRQHHEWMEEIFSSPYAAGNILPIDLGLGLMGELAPLTAGILDTPTGQHPPLASETQQGRDYAVKSYQKLDPEDLKQFEANVEKYTTEAEAELEKIRTAHANKMARLKKSRTYIRAERRLRDAARNSSAHSVDGADPVDTVVNELEKSLGVAFDTKKEVVCLDKGGYTEQQAPPPKAQQTNGNGTSNSNTDAASTGLMDMIDAENSAASLLDQYGSNSLTGTPGANLSVPISQVQSQTQSAVATPNPAITDPGQPSGLGGQAATEATNNGNDLLDLDVEMSGMTEAEGKGEGDWVVVDSADTAQPANNDQSTAGTGAATDAAAAPSGADAEPPSMFDTADFGSFEDLDTAGDALADYTNVDNMGLDLVDDSAFGDAFHGTEMHHGETADGDNA